MSRYTDEWMYSKYKKYNKTKENNSNHHGNDIKMSKNNKNWNQKKLKKITINSNTMRTGEKQNKKQSCSCDSVFRLAEWQVLTSSFWEGLSRYAE